MVASLPWYVYVVFIITTIFSVIIFIRSTPSPVKSAAVLTGWMVLQALLSWSGFYLAIGPHQLPWQLALLLLPVIVVILFLFFTPRGVNYLDGFSLQKLTWLHVLRIPVELVIWWWWQYQLVPKGMTFEGANPDVLSGLSALVVALLLNYTNYMRPKILLAWNIVCLLLVLNILVRGILSLPTPFQQLGAGIPNTAVLYFPFTWLPAVIVPLVVFSHLAAIRKLLKITGKSEVVFPAATI